MGFGLIPQEEQGEGEALPDEILGFKRVLAGIYSHTSAYVVAAPMAHHIALEGSRFRYSHDQAWLPAEGVQSLIDGKDMVMRFRNVGGKQVAVHKAMNYLHRPLAMEHMCLYVFFQTIYFLPRSLAKEIESFDFLEEHPCSSIEVAAYRDTSCVPVFPWTFLESTSCFETSILDTVNEMHPDYSAKEEYAKKFMILFLPFRSADDLKVGGSYQKALQAALRDGRISEEMLDIANNIQNIHNSLNSELVDDPLLSITHLEEAEETTQANQKEDPNLASYIDSIGDYFASTTQGSANLTEDATELNPKTIWKDSAAAESPTLEQTDTPANSAAMESVISFTSKKSSKKQKPKDSQGRFRTTTSELNSLAMTRRFTSDSNNNMAEFKADGTWDSIIAFGKIAKLDAEQQIAYEILTATYVLTFYDEAEDNLTTNEEKRQFLQRKLKLRKLTRRKSPLIGNVSQSAPDQPLRMFVTGPPGAGKCKHFSSWSSNMLLHPLASDN